MCGNLHGTRGILQLSKALRQLTSPKKRPVRGGPGGARHGRTVMDPTHGDLDLKGEGFLEDGSARQRPTGPRVSAHGLVLRGIGGTPSIREPVDPGPTPYESAVLAERVVAVHLALQALRTGDRQVIWVCYFEGRSLRQISDASGMSVEAVRSQRRRAEETLRVALRRAGMTPEVA